MDLNLKDRDFWYSLHGQVPGLLDWDFDNEFFPTCTTDQCSLVEQNLAKYKIRIRKTSQEPENSTSSADNDSSQSKPNLWMWVNPNHVCPINNLEAPRPNNENTLTNVLPFPHPSTADAASTCSEAQGVVEAPSCSSSNQSLQQEQSTSSRSIEEPTKKIKERRWKSALSFKRNTKRVCKRQKAQQGSNQEKAWPRPPLNYSHLIALALKNSPSCTLNVQQIYNFTLQHFPFFCTAPEGWKNTIRHNLCFLGCFEKVPVTAQEEADGKSRACLWRLTEEGQRHFQEETRLLATARKESIQKSMSHPELMDSLFHF